MDTEINSRLIIICCHIYGQRPSEGRKSASAGLPSFSISNRGSCLLRKFNNQSSTTGMVQPRKTSPSLFSLEPTCLLQHWKNTELPHQSQANNVLRGCSVPTWWDTARNVQHGPASLNDTPPPRGNRIFHLNTNRHNL